MYTGQKQPRGNAPAMFSHRTEQMRLLTSTSALALISASTYCVGCLDLPGLNPDIYDLGALLLVQRNLFSFRRLKWDHLGPSHV